MKYNKLTRLITISALVCPMILSAQTALADEVTTSTTTEPTSDSSTEQTVNSSTEVTAPTTEEKPVTDPIVEIPEVPEEPVVKTYELKANDVSIGSTQAYTDTMGNTLRFSYDTSKGLVAGTAVTYTVTLNEKYNLSQVALVNETTNKDVLRSSEITGTFTMPEANVKLQLNVTEKPVEKPTEPTDNSNNNSGSSSNNNNNGNTNGSTANNSGNNTAQTNNNDGNSSNRQPAATQNNNASDTKVPNNSNLPTYSNAVQTAIVQAAYSQLGKPYVWGAKGPSSFDCSGLAYYVYKQATGQYIGGWTGDQQFSGTQIPVNQAQPGDLLFWGSPTGVTSHVAIYIGNGQYIHAPRTGDVVKITNISSYTPSFAVRVNIAGLPAATATLENAFGGEDSSSFNFERNQTTDAFIEKISEYAREIGLENDIYASVMIAQAILESGSGNSALSAEPNYNLFGIKGSYEGESVEFSTLEQDSEGTNYAITAHFRKYPSYKESLEDYAKLLTEGVSGNSEYYKATWKAETTSYEEATEYLQGRYATDKKYAAKLNAIIEAYDLTTYDSADTEGPNLRELKTSFSLSDSFNMEFMTFGPQLDSIFNSNFFADLFKSDKIIALSADSIAAKQTTEKTETQLSSVYIALSNSVLAFLPPIE